MSSIPTNIEPRSPRVRSRVTNGSRNLLFGDQRSAGARRLRDVRAALLRELNCADGLPESAKQVVCRAAQTSVECEILKSLKAAGENIDAITYATAFNAHRRAMKDFAALKAQFKAQPKTLQQHLAERARAVVTP